MNKNIQLTRPKKRTMRTPIVIFAPVLFLALIPWVESHGFIKSWAADGQKFEKAQKQPLDQTAFRDAPSNIGWIGSQFIHTPAITCGASDTPKDQVASPGGTIFSAREQSAKKTLPVKAGGKVSLIVSGNPGEGFPHPTGHVLTYLGHCGPSPTACQDFDATQTTYHRIQAEIDGVSNKLAKQFDSEQGGDRWDVPIPQDVVDGSYIMRVEIIAFGQSSPQEGKQDQYYVFCGQVFIKGGTGSTGIPNDGQPTVKFPGAYTSGNISPKSLPGVTESGAGSQDDIKSKNLKEKKVQKVATQSIAKSDTSPPEASSSGTSSELASSCGDKCYKKKLTELNDLAPNCSSEQFSCLCQSVEFVKAYQNCCNDHCQGTKETGKAVTEIYDKCAAANPSNDSSNANGKSDSGAESSGVPSKNLRVKNPAPVEDSDKKQTKSSFKKLPTACNGVCYKAKTTQSELHHLAPSCSTDDLDCICRSHKWVCAYAQCSEQNCPSSDEAKKATDEIYAICEARLSSPNRLKSLPTTDYIPEKTNPSPQTLSKSKKCTQNCLRKLSSKGNCNSLDNLDCICKSRSDVCAWAKCAEDECFDEVDAIRLASDDIYQQCSKQ